MHNLTAHAYVAAAPDISTWGGTFQVLFGIAVCVAAMGLGIFIASTRWDHLKYDEMTRHDWYTLAFCTLYTPALVIAEIATTDEALVVQDVEWSVGRIALIPVVAVVAILTLIVAGLFWWVVSGLMTGLGLCSILAARLLGSPTPAPESIWGIGHFQAMVPGTTGTVLGVLWYASAVVLVWDLVAWLRDR